MRDGEARSGALVVVVCKGSGAEVIACGCCPGLRGLERFAEREQRRP
jgi:uncharacterized ferredoxin-like protein